MGRAGELFLALLVQDLGPAYVDEEHGFSVHPPAAWGLRETAPGSVGFAPRDRSAPPAYFRVTHYSTSNPTPLKSFLLQAKEFIRGEFREARFSQEKEMRVSGRPAVRLAFTCGGDLQLKTIVHRTNLEYYLLDARMPESESSRYGPLLEAAMDSLAVLPLRLTAEEGAAHGRFLACLRSGISLPPEFAGEERLAVFLGKARIGGQRSRVSLAADGRVEFALDISADFGGGNRDGSVVRGMFTLDARSQTVEVERVKENPQERWRFRASGSLAGGRARVSRDMNGFREEADFAVEEGVLFEDVADVFEKLLAAAGKGSYLLRALSPYEDEPGVRFLEVSERETMEISGRREEAAVVFRRRDRGKTETFYYGAGGRLIRQGGLKEAFHLRAVSREEFEKP